VTAPKKATPGEATLGVTESSRGRTTTVTLPDGSTATRTSKTKAYTHAVVVTTDHRGEARDMRKKADGQERFADALQAWMDNGADTSKLVGHPTASLSLNEQRRGKSKTEYYLPGFEPVQVAVPRSRFGGGGTRWDDPNGYSLPNFKDTERLDFPSGDEFSKRVHGKTAWEAYGPAHVLKEKRSRVVTLHKKADELDAGPAESHAVWRWSQSLPNAAKGRAEFEQVPNTRLQIIGVGGEAKELPKPAKMVPSVEDKAASKATALAAQKERAALADRRWAESKGMWARDNPDATPEQVIGGATDKGVVLLAEHYGVKVPRLKAERGNLKADITAAMRREGAPEAPKAEAPKVGAPNGIRPTDGRPDVSAITKMQGRNREYDIGHSRGRTTTAAPDIVRAGNGVMDGQPASAEIMNPVDGTGGYRYRIYNDQTGATLEEGASRDLAEVKAKVDRMYSSQRGGGMARTAGNGVHYEARSVERKKDPSRGDFGKGPFYDHTVVEVRKDGSEHVRVKTGSASKAEAQAAEINAKEGVTPPVAATSASGLQTVDLGNGRTRIGGDRPGDVWVDKQGNPVANPSQTAIVRGDVKLLPRVGTNDAQAAALRPRIEGETDFAYSIRTAPSRDAAVRILNGYNMAGLRAIARDEKVTVPSGATKPQMVDQLTRSLHDRAANSNAIDEMVRGPRAETPAARTVTPQGGPAAGPTPKATMTGAELLAQRRATSSANLEKGRAVQRDMKVEELKASKTPTDNAAKIRALVDGRMGSADLYRTAMAGPSGQRAAVFAGHVRHTPDHPSGEFSVTDRNGQRAGWVTSTVHNGKQAYAVHSENYDGETKLLGWADTISHAADVLTNGEAAASTGGTLDARRISGRLFEPYQGRNKSVAELDREALDREIRQHREALANPNLTPGIRARREASLAKLEAERRGEPPTSPQVAKTIDPELLARRAAAVSGNPKASPVDGLDDMQRQMLASIKDDPERYAEVRRRFIAGNAPHPFRQQAAKTLDQRLAGLPEIAKERARKLDPARVSGITASSVASSHHNFGSGGNFFTVYAGQFGDEKAQLGNIQGDGGMAGDFQIGDTGKWVKVAPLGKHQGEDWSYVWIDPQRTKVPDKSRRPGR